MFSFKKTSKTLGALLGICALAACAPLPGKNDLEKDANTQPLKLSGNYQDIANCVSDKFDREPFKMGELATPVNGYKPNTQKQTIELSNSSTVGAGYYNWVATFTQATASAVEVSIIARKSVHPVLPNDYMINKVSGYVKSCTGK